MVVMVMLVMVMMVMKLGWLISPPAVARDWDHSSGQWHTFKQQDEYKDEAFAKRAKSYFYYSFCRNRIKLTYLFFWWEVQCPMAKKGQNFKRSQGNWPSSKVFPGGKDDILVIPAWTWILSQLLAMPEYSLLSLLTIDSLVLNCIRKVSQRWYDQFNDQNYQSTSTCIIRPL